MCAALYDRTHADSLVLARLESAHGARSGGLRRVVGNVGILPGRALAHRGAARTQPHLRRPCPLLRLRLDQLTPSRGPGKRILGAGRQLGRRRRVASLQDA
jgi:hypothetical protein